MTTLLGTACVEAPSGSEGFEDRQTGNLTTVEQSLGASSTDKVEQRQWRHVSHGCDYTVRREAVDVVSITTPVLIAPYIDPDDLAPSVISDFNDVEVDPEIKKFYDILDNRFSSVREAIAAGIFIDDDWVRAHSVAFVSRGP